MDLKNIFNVGYQGFPDGTVSFFSNRICELTGYGKEELPKFGGVYTGGMTGIQPAVIP